MEISKRYYEYDFIRGLAVLLVIIGHYLCHFHGYMNYGERFLKIHGIGVGMFFFISGYLISLSFNKSSNVQFCIHRYLRIAPALIVTVILLSLVYGGFSTARLVNTSLFIGDFNAEYNISGIDTWTLNTEIRFYIIMFIVFGIYLKRDFNNTRKLLTSYFMAVAIVLSAIYILCHYSYSRSFSGPIWNIFCILYLFFGVIYYLYTKKMIENRVTTILLVLNLLIVLIIKSILYKQPIIELIKDEYLVGALLSICIIINKKYIPDIRFVYFLAYISYSLYLVHHPIIANFGIFGLILTFLTASALSCCVEHPFLKLSKRIV